MIRFQRYDFSLKREPFLRPFHFKGGSFNEKWINITTLDSGGTRYTGIGGNAVLWSDPAVFAAHSETGGNLVMSLVAAIGMVQASRHLSPAQSRSLHPVQNTPIGTRQ